MTTCRHTFVSSDVPQYERCSICGTYHSLGALDPKEIYDKDYWSEKWGHGSIKDQNYNVEKHLEHGICKNEFVMNLIWTQDRSAALEIACSPGSLLKRLKEQFEDVCGIEVDQAYEKDIREMAGGQDRGLYLVFGYFPEAMKPSLPESFSLVLGLDIFEHSHEPEAFLAECHRLLKPDGQLLLMMPMGHPPDRFFHPIEHVYIHSEEHIRRLLKEHGFTAIKFDRWTAGHETVTARKI
jgi:SAM-dependent methyltransferase